METPLSTRRITRSQAKATSCNTSTNSSSSSNNVPVSRKMEDSERNLSKSRQRINGQQQQDRSALIDITNDSPIVGLASGNLETPSSSIAKLRGSRMKSTPGSGEALLRGQVKTLLQKVEEEAEISKLSLEIRPFVQFVNSSPMGLLAPTPANTPQIQNLSGDGCLNNSGLASVTSSPIVEEQLISQVVNQIFDGKNQENPESEKSLITRSLLMDFSDKSEVSDCSSELTQEEGIQGGSGGHKDKCLGSTEDDNASVWSIQVNASTHDEEYDDEEEIDEEEEYYEDIEEGEGEEEYEFGDDGGLSLDELCAGLNNISVNERVAPKFAGKHTRFVYNSDDELVEEQEVEYCAEIASASSASNMLHLKGLPTPKGKHLRFPEEEEEEEKSVF